MKLLDIIKNLDVFIGIRDGKSAEYKFKNKNSWNLLDLYADMPDLEFVDIQLSFGKDDKRFTLETCPRWALFKQRQDDSEKLYYPTQFDMYGVVLDGELITWKTLQLSWLYTSPFDTSKTWKPCEV